MPQSVRRSSLYTMERVGPSEAGLRECDALIVATGKERRGLSIVSAYSDTKLELLDQLVVVDFEELLSNLDPDELSPIREQQAAVGQQIHTVSGTLSDPSSCRAGLANAKLQEGKHGRIAIDMTLFSRPFLFWLLKYLRRTCPDRQISVYYTEPESYQYPSGSFDSYQGTHGPLEVLEVPGYPGMAQQSSQSNLTVLLGFDGQLATAINEDIAPQQTVVVSGFPSYFPKYKDISRINNERLYSGAESRRYCPADNPFETYNVLCDIRSQVDENSNVHFMTVAPLGPKPMALGACMFALDYEDVRIVYPRPKEYVAQTARASWRSWRYDLEFK